VPHPPGPTPAAPRRHRLRGRLALTLVVAAGATVVAATLGGWKARSPGEGSASAVGRAGEGAGGAGSEAAGAGSEAGGDDADALVAASSGLLPLRVPDPRGGLPWGIRLVHTTGGLVCLQVGRVAAGQLVQLGIDGAFADDGRSHPISVDALPRWGLPETVNNAECVAPDETFAAEIDGLDRNALSDPLGDMLPDGDRRLISFGMLGPHALAISYPSTHGVVTTRSVLRGLGAYLVVSDVRRGRRLEGIGVAPGSDNPDDTRPAGLTGVLTAITYRYGRRTCVDNGHDGIVKLCGLPGHPLHGWKPSPEEGGV
jgi:hypothetical protein